VIREAGLPCGPINKVPEVFDHPQVQQRDLILEVEHPSAGKVPLTGFPYKLSRTPAKIQHHPPDLGEHNLEILVDLLDFNPEQVADFKEKGII